ncbi:MAG TPA: glyceraldehyde 3-phosphate dehydrogenase NAD-binding domain-containing protein, partial [Dongiaceae bacterium]|nr:glyceraldehyde 3-phosphate dehydrogenase NAD-binding domain-containing protein [Dongiaceae bacterium]
MAIRIGINGLGRIGRGLLRRSLDDADLVVTAVNDLAPPATLAHLLRHDSIYGPLAHEVVAEAEALRVDGRRIPWTGRRVPAEIPWRAAGVDYVVEATGQFARREAAAGHLAGGARRVVISAPSPDADVTLCLGVNDASFDPAR